MSFIAKMKTGLWYLTHPKYYSQVPALIRQKLFKSKKEDTAVSSVAWCREVAMDTDQALILLTGKPGLTPIKELFPVEYSAALEAETKCPVRMGGAGNLDLIYHLCEYVQAKTVVETGVAYGWSSFSILLSLNSRNGSLYSIDMPYAKMNNEDYVGSVVLPQMRKNWDLIRLPDRKGIKIALSKAGSLDLCHYDSDKSYEGRMFAYPLLWNALRSGGIFMSDDIQDNLGFHDFSKKLGITPVIVSMDDKYIGVLKKP